MSFSCRATGSSFDTTAWRAGILAELENERAGWKPLPHTGRLTEDDNWLLLVNQSIRGVEVVPVDGGAEVQVAELGSAMDFKLAFRLLELALEHGAEVKGADGITWDKGDLTGMAALATFEDHWAADRAAMEPPLTLPVGIFSLVVSPEKWAMEGDELVGCLTLRVRRHASAHPATLMVLRSEDQKHEISAANYGQVATLIPQDATHITFGAPGGEAIEGVVAVEDFQNVFGELVEPAGKFWFVPAIDFEEERVIFKALKEKAKPADKALPAAPKPVPHPDEKPISEAQWDILESGPAMVFLAVAAADGKVGKRETTAFAKVIVEAEHLEAECPSLGRALGASLDKVPEIIAQIEAADDYDARAELKTIGRTIDECLSEDEAKNHKLGLLFIGKEVAEASGGFFGLGRRISLDEASALKMIADAFGVEVEGG